MSVTTGGSAPGIATGTPMATDNTGRDVGQAVGLGAATAGAVIGSILTWGAASPALIAGDAAAIGGTIANDAVQDQSQAHDQQRQEQGALDSAQKQQTANAAPPMPLPAPPPSAAPPPMGGAPGLGGAPPLPGAVKPVSPLPPPPNAMQGASDRRVKTAIADGSSAADDFLAMARERCWPAGLK